LDNKSTEGQTIFLHHFNYFRETPSTNGPRKTNSPYDALAMNFPATSSSPPLSTQRKLELLHGSYPYIFRTVKDSEGNDTELHAYCFYPEGMEPEQEESELKPVILFLHGGCWDVSMVTQFSPHAMHFASRGIVAIVAEYRVDSTHHSSPEDAFEDAETLMLWLKYNHESLRIDPNRIIIAGAACGAYMALSLAMRKKKSPKRGYAAGFTSQPQGVIAISSIVHSGRRAIDHRRFPNAKQPSKNHPINNVRRKLPPCLMIHGKADTIAPYYMVFDFVKMMRRKRNRCDLIDFDACNHSFFNFNVSPEHFEITLNSMDAFLAELGYIPPIEYR
jgi:acetyl esterase/lipase